MLQLRTCPPLEDLQQGGPEVEIHLRSCPECRERLEEAKDLLAFDKAFMKDMPPRQANPAPASGQVWQLMRSAVPGGICNSHGWHNPPMVIVLPDETGVPGMLRVAQIHDAGELAGPGDYMLTGMFADCFAESWNTWPAFSDSMTYVGDCSPKIAAMVSEAAKQRCAMPEEDSIEFYFRRQELNIGAFYGKSAVSRGLALLDAVGDAEETSRPLRKANIIPFREWMTDHKVLFASQAYDGSMAAAAAPLTTTGAAKAFFGQQRPARVKLVINDDTDNFRWLEATMSIS
ncbi:MAG: hypothetical protein IJS08_16420, partial [Victivallales bacterium]|nr:hypothetical protein [Victivallales bacterium]